MNINKINKDFPSLKPGDLIDIIDCNNKLHEKVTVFRIWYPKFGDNWNETEECKHLGYLCSRPEDPFPQILVKMEDGVGYRITGDDTKQILKIY